MPHDIGFLVFPDFQILDLTGPLSAFEMPARTVFPKPYRLHVLSERGGSVESSSGLEVITRPLSDQRLDTLIVAGGPGTAAAAASSVLKAFVLRTAVTARRTTSVCTGAFILAAAGLLNSRRATTHWNSAALLQRLYPQIDVESDRIFVKDGSIWTSAGISAGVDLALALIEEDLGTEIARAAARQLVVYFRRPGGQSQFSALLDLDPSSDRIRQALTFAREHLHEPLSVEQLAKAASLSTRQFGRAFLSETGQTPAKAIEQLRAEVARLQIEIGFEPIEMIARSVGFSDPERMRRAFIRAFGQPPQALRRIARNGGVRSDREQRSLGPGSANSPAKSCSGRWSGVPS
jgi:transcriptional regulator GlxA family with amidase domain